MIMKWLDANRWIALGAFVALLFGVTLLLTQCGGNDDAAKQAQQTSKSGAAINAAASDAVNTITNRNATEDTIDQGLAAATEAIHNAKDTDTVRNAVLDSVCKQASHRNDPACRVR